MNEIRFMGGIALAMIGIEMLIQALFTEEDE